MRSYALMAGAIFLAGTYYQQTKLPAPLVKSLEKLSAAPSVTVSYNFRLLGESPVEYKLELAKGNLFRFTTPTGFTLSDGKTLFVYDKKANTYIESPLTEDAIAEFTHRPELFGWADYLAKVPGEEIAAAKAGADRSVAGTAVTPIDVTMKKGSVSGTLFIDKKLQIARGYSLKVGDKDYLAMATALEVGKESAANTLFAFAAPAGAKKAEVVVASKEGSFADVQAIMNASCMPCHSAGRRSGGFDLTTFDGISRTVVPGNSGASQLYTSVSTGRMPKNRAKLAQAQITSIQKWIDGGAKAQ